jgi:hypothetical protein
VRADDLLKRQIDGIAQVEIVLPPLANVPIKEMLKWLARPSHGVDAIGYRVDGILREHTPCYLAMAHGNPVDVARESKRHIRQVDCPTM